MKKIIKKTKKNREPAQYRRRKSSGSGFVILFAVTISAILLSIALGVSNIALRQMKFSTSARDTNDAFFAADTGKECAMVHDKSSSDNFISGNSSFQIICNNSSINVIENSPSYWSFNILDLGSRGESCANISVDKTNPSRTYIISKGYNKSGGGAGTCEPGLNTVERQIRTTIVN